MLRFERQRHDFGQTFDVFSYSIAGNGHARSTTKLSREKSRGMRRSR